MLFLGAVAVAATAVLIVAVCPDPFDPDDQAGAQYDCDRNAANVRQALTAYAEEHGGRFPATLKELGSQPVCRMAKAVFSYHPKGRAFELYCEHHGVR
mgnify:CR=1 FL=1